MTKLITVIFHELEMENVEITLIDNDVLSYSFYKVRGRGRHYNSFGRDHLSEHIRLDIYIASSKAKEIVKKLKSALSNPALAEGFISVMSVESLTMFNE